MKKYMMMMIKRQDKNEVLVVAVADIYDIVESYLKLKR